MLNSSGRTGEFRIAFVVLVISLIVLVAKLPDGCGDGYEPIWMLLTSAFTFTMAFIWLLLLFFEGRGYDRPLGMVYAVSCNLAIGFVGWGLSDQLLGYGTPDRGIMHQSYVWVPFWIVGTLLGTDFFNTCGGGD